MEEGQGDWDVGMQVSVRGQVGLIHRDDASDRVGEDEGGEGRFRAEGTASAEARELE